jgi:hypothetical protein
MNHFAHVFPKRINIFIFIIFIISSSLANSQTCKELNYFKDNTLFNEYNNAFNKYTVNQQAKDNAVKIKTDLLNDTRWSTSDAGLTTAIIAQNIKTTCNLIGNLLKFNPATGITGTVATRTLLTAERIYNVIEAGQTLKNIIDDGAEKTGYDVLLSYGNPLGQAVKTAWNLSDDISKMVSLPADRLALKNDVKRVLDMVDAEIVKYDQAANDASLKLNEINQIKAGIDKYLLDNCRPVTFRGGGNSNPTSYGINGFCSWTMQMLNVVITFSINKENNTISGGQIANDEVEKTTSGKCVSNTRFRDTYNQSGYKLTSNNITINFSPIGSNHQKCNARFIGKISGKSITGNIIWNRTDQPQTPSIQYTVGMPVTLQR